jgi:hypothetical protein
LRDSRMPPHDSVGTQVDRVQHAVVGDDQQRDPLVTSGDVTATPTPTDHRVPPVHTSTAVTPRPVGTKAVP